MSGELGFPWHRGNTGADLFQFLNADDRYCGHVQIVQTGGGSIASFDEDRRAACAEAILARVNLHDELVAALRESCKQLNGIIEDGIPTDWRAWLADLEAALAKLDATP